MAGAQQQQGQSQDSGLGPIWVLILLFIVAATTWYYAHTFIVALIFQVKLFQAEAINFFTNQLTETILTIKTTSPADVDWHQVQLVSTQIGNYVRFPVIAMLVGLASILYFSNVKMKFKKTYTMKQLADQENLNWPQIMPTVNIDLIKEDINKGPWAMGTQPLTFAKKYQLLRIEQPKFRRSFREEALPDVTVIKGKARQVFIMQLGQLWRGPDALPAHMKLLFAVFGARANHDRKDVRKLLDQVNRSTLSGKLNFSGAEPLLRKHYNSKVVQRVLQRHAYVYTVMASMLAISRDDGVFPTAEFLWLKPLDRRLWYILNSVGRQTPYSEGAGPFAHWLAENKLRRRSISPMVEQAVIGLEAAVKEVKYREDEDEGL